jgi:tetratricopeptide (TPR) repeat protein
VRANFFLSPFSFAFIQMLSCRTESNSSQFVRFVGFRRAKNCRMKTPNYNLRAAVLLLLLTALSLTHVFATGFAQEKLPPPSGHINDFASVLGGANKERLESILEQLKKRTDIDMVIALVKTAGTEDLYDYSLRLANDWTVGSRTASQKTLLLVIAADSGKFFTQFSRSAQAALPDGLVGEMGRKMRPKFEANDYDNGLLAGVQTFVGALGELHNFTLADLDSPRVEVAAAKTRPRKVESPRSADTPAPQPSELPTPEPSPASTPSETPARSVTPTPTPEASTPQPTPVAVETPTPAPTISQTPATEATPTPAASPVETPSAATQASPSPEASPSTTAEVARNVNKPIRSARASMTRANPEDEKEEVELTLTKPVAERIDLLKRFIASHPKSAAIPRAQELIVTAHATVGDQKLAAGDVDGGLDEFSSAIAEVPSDMSDRLFTEVIARIPMNLFLRGQRGPALQAAHQAEGLAKLNPVRLLAVTQFYLAIEDATEANRLAELTVQNAPDMAAAHQALGAARHIALRLDDAEAEYSKAVSLDAKSLSAKLAWADLQRAVGKNEAALAAYREVSDGDPKNQSAIAGVILSLFELGRKEEANQQLNAILQDADKSRNLPLLVGAAYWFVAHSDATRALELAQKAVVIEPRYSWAQIAAARALAADKRPLDAERAVRFARAYARFPTLDYELATVLASMGLYDEALTELSKTFSLKDGQIEAKLAGRVTTRAATFTELLAPERRAAIFQNTSADTEANARMLKGLLAFAAALNPEGRSTSDEDLIAIAQDFVGGDDPMRTYRRIYVASKLLRKGVALTTVVDLMDAATGGVDAALNIPAATVAVQPDELAESRARALAQGGTPNVPNAPRSALSAILRARIEDIAGMALLNLDKPIDAVARLRRAVSVAPQGTPLWRSSMWHLATGLEADGKHDQALLYYINSYRAGAPDPARRAVIENVYKKVNGTLDGLDDKIGPAYSSSAPSPAASPTPNQK